MTSDFIQNTYALRERSRLAKKAFSSTGFAGVQPRKRAFGVIKTDKPELTETVGSAAVANVNVNVKNSPLKVSKEPQKEKTFNKTALLKTAYKMLRQAERDLAHMEERIQTLQEILTVDELTGLTNRRGFFHAFERELDRTNRGENEGGLLIMIDLDYFKDINDRYGHLAGDEALRTVGRFLGSSTRPMDITARLGGDEFIILMPNSSIGKAMIRARKLGNAINDLTFDWGGDAIQINASIGLKEYVCGDTIENIIEQADRGLYQDKKERKDLALFAAE